MLTCFSNRSTLSVVSSGSERCFFPLNIHCINGSLPLSEWRVVLILSFPLCPAPPTPQGYALRALSTRFCCCCGGNVEISWSGVRFFFWKDKGSRGEKDTSYRMASKSVYLPSPCDVARSRRYRSCSGETFVLRLAGIPRKERTKESGIPNGRPAASSTYQGDCLPRSFARAVAPGSSKWTASPGPQ